MSIKTRLTSIERLAGARDDVAVILVHGGTHCGRGVARDPAGDLVVHQTDGEGTEAFVRRAIAEARVARCRQIVIRLEA